MEKITHVVFKAKVSEIVRQLEQLRSPQFVDASDPALSEKEIHAVANAIDWLGDVANPLTPEEQQCWTDGGAVAEIDALADDKCYNLATLIVDGYNDAARRDALEYMNEE